MKFSCHPSPRLPRASLIAGVLIGLMASTTQAGPALQASGSVSFEGQTSELKHLKVGRFNDYLVVVASDMSLPPPCTIYDPAVVSDHQPLTAVVFTVDPETLTLWDHGQNMFLHPDIESYQGVGSIRQGVTLQRAEGGLARGSLETSLEIDGKIFEISLQMSFPLEIADDPIVPRTVTGVESKPGKSFAKFVAAVLDGDFQAVKKLAAAETLAQLEQITAEEAGEMLVMYADAFLPTEITITNTEIEGDRAVLTAEGRTEICLGDESSTGRIELVRQSGAWRVASISFES